MKHYSTMDSPVGQLIMTAIDNTLTSIGFANGPTHSEFDASDWELNDAPFRALQTQLRQYFDGKRTQFDVDIDLDGQGTPFRRSVWRALADIPYGETRSYRSIAEAVDRPKGFRAVGQANHHNPFVIVIPCHRVVGSNGSLTGFGGGLDKKELLLKLEQEVLAKRAGES